MDAEASQKGQTSISSFRIQDSKSPIIYLDIQPRTESDAENPRPNLLVIHQDGQIRVVPGDLKQEMKNEAVSQNINGPPEQPVCVEYVSLMGIQQAKKALLKGREDVLQAIQSPDNIAQVHGSSGLSLLALIVRSNHDRTTDKSNGVALRIFAVRPTAAQTMIFPVSGKSSVLNELISIPIPELQISNADPPSYTLHAPSGTLYQHASAKLRLYNASGLVLRHVHDISLSNRDVYSHLRLTSNTMLVVGEETLDIVDATYGSLQAQVSLSPLGKGRRRSGKFKKQGPTRNDDTRTHLLSYFAPLGMVVALQNHRLIAFQISPQSSLESTSRKRGQSGRLIDAVDHAFNDREVPKAQKIKRLRLTVKKSVHAPDIGGEWRKTQAELNRCIEHGRINEFEQLVASELGLSDIDHGNCPVGLDHAIPSNQTKVSYVLSKIFGLKTEAQRAVKRGDEDLQRLKITFFPPRIYRFLVSRGCIVSHQVEKSLKQYGVLPVTSRLTTDALIEAIVEMDQSLTQLLVLLEGPSTIEATSLAHAIRISVDGLHGLGPDETPKLLMSGEEDHNMPDQDDDSTSQTPKSKSSDKERMEPTFSRPSNASMILDRALDNISTYGSATITVALRQSLSPSGLRHLIDVLRMSLAQNGWLTPYTNPVSAPLPSTDLNTGLANTLKVLNSTLTAIGTSGFLLSTSLPPHQATETADTITYMKAETSAALEGIQEATYLKGVLGETLLYAHSLVKQKRDKKMIFEDSKELPLGMKATQPIEMTKVGAGGETQKRSMRDIGRLKSRLVGEYSFERIVI